MSGKWASKLTDSQMRLARRIEAEGLATVSQAVKAIERGDEPRIAAWKQELARRDKAAAR